jgi:hypothetical protein
LTEENRADFAGINTNDPAFTKIQRAIRMACAQTRKDEYESKGDDKMASLYAGYLSKEEREAAEARGEAKGEMNRENLIKIILHDLKNNISITEISKKTNKTIEEINEWKAILEMRSA